MMLQAQCGLAQKEGTWCLLPDCGHVALCKQMVQTSMQCYHCNSSSYARRYRSCGFAQCNVRHITEAHCTPPYQGSHVMLNYVKSKHCQRKLFNKICCSRHEERLGLCGAGRARDFWHSLQVSCKRKIIATRDSAAVQCYRRPVQLAILLHV